MTMHSNLEYIKYDINMGGSRKFFALKKSKCLNPKWIFSKGQGRATVFYVHTERNKKLKRGGVTYFYPALDPPAQ